MGKLFGTDGVRGVANRSLTPETALQLGRAGAYVLTRECKHTPKIIMGNDTRRSGKMLEAALAAGLCSVGADVYHAGVIPTPAIAYLVRKYGFDAGVMISASHNPMEDNGIKFFNAEGYKLRDALEDEIENIIARDISVLPRPEGKNVGIISDIPNAASDYISHLISTVPGLSLEGTAVALDCANGAVSRFAPAVFKALGAEVLCLYAEPDGANINAGCGSTHIEALRAYMSGNRCDIGFAFHGDGDRLLCVDDAREVVEGDAIIAVCGLDLFRRGLLAHDTIITTVMSNIGFTRMCRKNGITEYQTAVGDRYVLEKMLEGGYMLGGEQSGHIIFKEFSTTGDGILSAVQLMSVLRRAGKPLSELKRVMEIMPQVLLGAPVANERKAGWETNEAIRKRVKEIESELGDDGRILVRPSGTEPLIRVMIEGMDAEKINAQAASLIELVKKELN